jgi:hypothetical protein
MRDDGSREWTFQLNIAGLTLLLFAAGYIGQHLAVLAPVSGSPRILFHYLGELVLTAVSFGYALWRAYGASESHRDRVGWLKRSPVWFYVGLAAVALNLILLTVLLVLGKLA